MKETILKTIEELVNQGIDLEETPTIFEWSYPEYPDVVIKLGLFGPDERAEEDDTDVTVH